MGTDTPLNHHEKFFANLRKRFLKEQAKKKAPTLDNVAKAKAAIKAADGNKAAAARLLGWPRSKVRHYAEFPDLD